MSRPSFMPRDASKLVVSAIDRDDRRQRRIGSAAMAGTRATGGMRTPKQRAWEAHSAVHGPKFAAPGERSPARLIVFGAVPLAVWLTAAARAIGWIPYVVDPRRRFVTPTGFPAAERVIVAWPREAIEELGGLDEDTAVAALTHAPELDVEALILSLRSPAFYVGAMGSRNTQRKRRGG